MLLSWYDMQVIDHYTQVIGAASPAAQKAFKDYVAGFGEPTDDERKTVKVMRIVAREL